MRAPLAPPRLSLSRKLEAEAQADLAGFFKSRRHGLPFLTLKLASSFDGRIATATGESQWITGPQARHHVHGLRLAHDAVMVGAGTARSDDPLLNVRGFGQVPQPVRVVLSRRLDLPLNSRLAHSAGDVPLWLCHGPDADAALVQAWQGVGARLFECPAVGAHLAPHAVLQAHWRDDIDLAAEADKDAAAESECDKRQHHAPRP